METAFAIPRGLAQCTDRVTIECPACGELLDELYRQDFANDISFRRAVSDAMNAGHDCEWVLS